MFCAIPLKIRMDLIISADALQVLVPSNSSLKNSSNESRSLGAGHFQFLTGLPSMYLIISRLLHPFCFQSEIKNHINTDVIRTKGNNLELLPSCIRKKITASSGFSEKNFVVKYCSVVFLYFDLFSYILFSYIVALRTPCVDLIKRLQTKR